MIPIHWSVLSSLAGLIARSVHSAGAFLIALPHSRHWRLLESLAVPQLPQGTSTMAVPQWLGVSVYVR